MSEKEQLSRQQQSERKRKEAGLTQVKVYLDQATLQLLELLQKNVMGGEVKGDERNLSRSMAMIASIHVLARRRLGKDIVTEVIKEHLGSDYLRQAAYKEPGSFLLRSMINKLYLDSHQPSHRTRLDAVAGEMNYTSFRNPERDNGLWKRSDIECYLPSVEEESKT